MLRVAEGSEFLGPDVVLTKAFRLSMRLSVRWLRVLSGLLVAVSVTHHVLKRLLRLVLPQMLLFVSLTALKVTFLEIEA